MTWVDKLFERLIEEGAVTFDDDGRESDYAHTGDCILISDYDSAVLEKNREIQEEVINKRWVDAEARAFREQVAEAEKRKKKKNDRL